MNIKSIVAIIVGVILLNSSYINIIPLPGILVVAAVVAAAVLLLMNSAKGGFIGKANLALGIIIAVYALQAILSYVGITIPFLSFIYSVQSLAYLLGGALLIISPFM